MNIADKETDYGIIRRPEETHSWNLRQLLTSVIRKGTFMLLNSIEPYFLHVVQSSGESSCSNVVGRASLEFIGEFVEGGVFEADFRNHLAAPHIRWHLI